MNQDIEYNAIFKPVFETEKRYVILCGGSNAGKSYFIQQLLLMRFMSIVGYNILCIRKIYDSIGGSIFHLFQKLIKKWDIESKVHDPKYRIENRKNGNLILFGGLKDKDQRERTKSITAVNGNIEAIFVEEATQLTKDDYLELDRRMRGESDTGIPKQMFFSFNPIIETHWLKNHFKIELNMDGGYTNRNDTYLKKVTIEHNRWTTDEDWQVLENYRKDGDEYSEMIYRYGLWGVLGQDNVVIPYALFYKARNNKIENPEGIFKVGCDPARFGKNKTVIYYGRGLKFLKKKEFNKSDSYQMADAICAMDDEFRMDKSILLEIKIDAGEGGGVIDILKKRITEEFLKNAKVFEIHNNGTPKNPLKYDNIATESWFEFKDQVECMQFLPGDDILFSQCTGRTYRFKELKGKTGREKTVKAIESKEKYKERYEELHGESPDSADAGVLFGYHPPEKAEPGIEVFYPGRKQK